MHCAIVDCGIERRNRYGTCKLVTLLRSHRKDGSVSIEPDLRPCNHRWHYSGKLIGHVMPLRRTYNDTTADLPETTSASSTMSDLDELEMRLHRLVCGSGSSEDEALLTRVYEHVRRAHGLEHPASGAADPNASTASPPTVGEQDVTGPEPLTPLAPELDPSEARRSSLEVAWLYAAWKKLAAPSPLQKGPTTRAGYRIYADAHRHQACVFPVFAAALHAWRMEGDAYCDTICRQECRDLWSIDLQVWTALEARDFEAALLSWLESPGRRVVQELQALKYMLTDEGSGASSSLGATRLSRERIYEAAGWHTLPDGGASGELEPGEVWRAWRSRPGRWLEMHFAIPGMFMDSLLRQVPVIEDISSTAPERWIAHLTDGTPAMLRGAALARLLDQCVDQPTYKLERMPRNLRDDIAVHLAVAQRLREGRGQDPLLALEATSLELVSVLNRADRSAAAPLRGWGISRWLQRCLARSPWFGEDLESLEARLSALTPERAWPDASVDALDPSRFRADGDGIRIEDMALLSGLLAHYFDEEPRPDEVTQSPERRFLPVPLPLLETLRQLAMRPEKRGEREAEIVFQQQEKRSQLHWRAPHLSPPWVARWFMTYFDLTWLTRLPVDLQEECLSLIHI